MAPSVQHVDINHGRTDVFVTQQLLDRTDVIIGFKQVRGERMAEGMTPHILGHSGSANRFLHGPLQNAGVHAVASFLSAPGILPPILLREDPLPAPVGRGVGILGVQCISTRPQPSAKSHSWIALTFLSISFSAGLNHDNGTARRGCQQGTCGNSRTHGVRRRPSGERASLRQTQRPPDAKHTRPRVTTSRSLPPGVKEHLRNRGLPMNL